MEQNQPGSDCDTGIGSDSDSDSVVCPHFTGQAEEGELLDLDNLNLTLVQGCSSTLETGGLQRDQFVMPVKLHKKWYGLLPNQDRPAGSVYFWHCDSAKLKSAYSRIARASRLTTPALTSHTLSQETLRRWEKAACESSYVCNQAARITRCLNKGKLAGKVDTATESYSTL